MNDEVGVISISAKPIRELCLVNMDDLKAEFRAWDELSDEAFYIMEESLASTAAENVS